jgi:hypothetical protein
MHTGNINDNSIAVFSANKLNTVKTITAMRAFGGVEEIENKKN